jgi:lysine N-acyltransferase
MTDIDEALPVLPRELPSPAVEVRSIAAPPTPELADPYDIRVADPDDDAELISEWMNRPHLAQADALDQPAEVGEGSRSRDLRGARCAR